MTKVLLAALTAAALLTAAGCQERGEPAQQASERGDSAAAATAEPLAAPGEDAKLSVEGEGLLDRVKVSDGEARVVALTKVSGGRIVRAALEEEDGRLVYSYELVVEAKPGMITEVLVDALTAEAVSVSEEKAAK